MFLELSTQRRRSFKVGVGGYNNYFISDDGGYKAYVIFNELIVNKDQSIIDEGCCS